MIPTITEEEKQRFWEKVDIRTKNECWPWTAFKSGAYGQFSITRDGKQFLTSAHRFALFIHSNNQGPVARHRCDNPICCNPHHLVWGTQKENIDDMFAEGERIREEVHK